MRRKIRISYQIIVLCMSIYVLFALGIESFFDLDEATLKILRFIDFGVCLVFFYDFVLNFYKAKSKLNYMKWGWLDLLSSIPLLYSLHYAGIARIVRIIKILRGIKSIKVIIKYIMEQRGESAFWAVLVALFTLLQFSSIGFYHFEHGVNPMVQKPEDAIWWAFVTITTVGYGDIVPVTTFGRIIAGVLMSFGVGVFSLMTGFAASWFLGHDIRLEKKILRELHEVKKRIDR